MSMWATLLRTGPTLWVEEPGAPTAPPRDVTVLAGSLSGNTGPIADAVPLDVESLPVLDAVVPTCAKDVQLLRACLEGLRQNVPQLGRVFVVCPQRENALLAGMQLGDQVELVDEARFPFSLAEVAHALGPLDAHHNKAGWYLQQLIKLYACQVFGLQRALIVDSDTVFLRPVTFHARDGCSLLAWGAEHHAPYFEHMERVTKGAWAQPSADCSGICHHQVMEADVVAELMREVQEAHDGAPFWQAFLAAVDTSHNAGASEYELYAAYALTRHTTRARLRGLRWTNMDEWSDLERELPVARARGLDFVAFHAYARCPVDIGPFEW